MSTEVAGGRPATQDQWRLGPFEALAYKFEILLPAHSDYSQFQRTFEHLFAGLQASETDRPCHTYRVEMERHPSLPFTIYVNDEELSSGRHAEDFSGVLSWHINQSVIRESVDRFVLLHASAVRRDGVVVILPAEQESGKTTTAAGLLRAGFDYITDEAAALDPVSGEVTPFPKALSLDPGSWPLFPECAPREDGWRKQWQVQPATWGARSLTKATTPPRVIVFPRYSAGSETRLERVTPGEATLRMVECTFDFEKASARNLKTLGKVAAGAYAARLSIGSLTDAVAAIETLVDQRVSERKQQR